MRMNQWTNTKLCNWTDWISMSLNWIEFKNRNFSAFAHSHLVFGECRTKSHLLVAEPWILVVRTESGQFSATIILVVHIVCDILQVLQMRANNHVAQSNEITMFQIFNCKPIKNIKQVQRRPCKDEIIYLRQHPTDNDGHALCGHPPRPQRWRPLLRMAHDFWADATFLPPLHLQVVPENRRF